MPDSDTAGIRTIALAHTRLDDHEKRIIRAEVRQEEFTRRLEKLEHVPDDLAEIKAELRGINAKLEGAEKVSTARDATNTKSANGTAMFLDLLKALVLLILGFLLRGGFGG
jgi:hypothetical protein